MAPKQSTLNVIKTKTQKPPVAKDKSKDKDLKDMLGWMNYQAKEAKNADPLLKAQCAGALDVYKNLPKTGSAKSDFVSRWKATKGQKNMSWCKDFEETVKKERNLEIMKESGVFTRPALLAQHACSAGSRRCLTMYGEAATS